MASIQKPNIVVPKVYPPGYNPLSPSEYFPTPFNDGNEPSPIKKDHGMIIAILIIIGIAIIASIIGFIIIWYRWYDYKG